MLGSIDDPYILDKRKMEHCDDDRLAALARGRVPDLVATPSIYTKDQVKAHKNLDAYNFFVNGWACDVTVISLASHPGAFLALAQVKHSQRISATPLKPWVSVEKVGTVLCAHCTCMAGLEEACSHIAALLFILFI